MYRSKHGESFTNMLKAISDEGPLLVLVKEKHSNYIFGGYSSLNVGVGPNFFGTLTYYSLNILFCHFYV